MKILEDALAIEDAGCFMLEFEAVPARIARLISEQLTIPTIGIGAGPHCDGQVLVWQDAFGLRTGRMAKFVKQYADLHGVLLKGAEDFAAEVAEGTFPGPEHTFGMAEEEQSRLSTLQDTKQSR